MKWKRTLGERLEKKSKRNMHLGGRPGQQKKTMRGPSWLGWLINCILRCLILKCVMQFPATTKSLDVVSISISHSIPVPGI